MRFNAKALNEIRDKTQGLLAQNSLLVMTPNRLLADLGMGPQEMEALRIAVMDDNKAAVSILKNLERYRAYWEAEMEQLLIQQYDHPLLQHYRQRYDFNQVRLLLWQSRQKGILNHFVNLSEIKAMLPKKAIPVVAIEHRNESGIDDESI